MTRAFCASAALAATCPATRHPADRLARPVISVDVEIALDELKVMIRPAPALQLVGAKMVEEFPKMGLRLPN